MTQYSNLRQHLAKFFCNCVFENSQFKHIRNSFTHQYPQYKSMRFYNTIYQFVQTLVLFQYISVNRNLTVFTYSYNGLKNAPTSLLEEISRANLRVQLIKDQLTLTQTRLNIDIELELYRDKINTYPLMKDKIQKIIVKKTNEREKLIAEINILNELREAI